MQSPHFTDFETFASHIWEDHSMTEGYSKSELVFPGEEDEDMDED
jgi:hypothetical protein